MKTVAVIGLGYVGLPLCLAFVKAGMNVIGVDTDQKKPPVLNQGRSYIKHITDSDVSEAVQSGRFRASCVMSDIQQADAILICVPTPLTKHRSPDLSFVESTAQAVAQHLQRGQLVVLESTTYPGTTDEVVRDILEGSTGLHAGDDFYLAFSPEREDPGNPIGFGNIPKVVGGLTSECLSKAVALYGRVVKQVVPVSSCRVAEATKLTENIFRAVNIALVNELKIIYGAMGIDVWEVIRAASTKPFGFMPFYPGPGLGGHCIPIDPFYLTWKAFEYGHRTRLIELAGEINTAMPEYVVGRVTEALNEVRKAVCGAKVLVLGLAYKPNVDDDRESPSYEIIALLEKMHALVDYNDPHVPQIRPGRSNQAVAGRVSKEISSAYDVFVLCTNHDEYSRIDFAAIGVPLVDCRNAAKTRPKVYVPA